MMQRLIHILWPSFLVAGVADIIFTSLFDPLEIMYRGEPLIEQRLAAYTIGFFTFWLLGIASSMMTCYFQRSADEINRCPLAAAQAPGRVPQARGRQQLLLTSDRGQAAPQSGCSRSILKPSS
ncbi:MAG: hypothetical protein MZW92_39280 [Comamonadaceae bacterium]|nr:hypothetical protein [Comamonadaceae bacterium]